MIPPVDLRFTHRREGRATVIEVHGELDTFSAPQCHDHLSEVIAAGNRFIVLDLRHLAFINSTGLTVLVRAQKDLAAENGRFVLTAVPPMTMRILEITGLVTAFEIRSDDPAAIDAATEASGEACSSDGHPPRA